MATEEHPAGPRVSSSGPVSLHGLDAIDKVIVGTDILLEIDKMLRKEAGLLKFHVMRSFGEAGDDAKEVLESSRIGHHRMGLQFCEIDEKIGLQDDAKDREFTQCGGLRKTHEFTAEVLV